MHPAEVTQEPVRGPQSDKRTLERNRPAPHPSERLQSLLKANGLMNNEESAAYIGVAPGTLEVWRCTKRYNIPYIKVGRLVRYKKSSLDAFIESRTVEA